MVFYGALISKEGQAHTETHIYFYVFAPALLDTYLFLLDSAKA